MSDSGIRPLPLIAGQARPSDTLPEVGNEMVEDVGNSPPVGGVSEGRGGRIPRCHIPKLKPQALGYLGD